MFVDDADLVRRCAAGEAAAWDDLVRTHAPMLHRAASRVLGRRGGALVNVAADVDDVVQAVFLKLWDDGRRRLRTFEGKSRLSTWLVAITQREALDRLRSRAGAAAPVAEYGDASDDGFSRLRPEIWNGQSPPPDAAAEIREANVRLAIAIDTLPARDRLLVRLVYLDGCPYVEVARLLSIPENSISPWLGRARQRLKTLLAPVARTDRPPSPLQREA